MSDHLPHGIFFLLSNGISSVAILPLILLLWKLIRTKLNQRECMQTQEGLSVLCEKQSTWHSLSLEHRGFTPSIRLPGGPAPDQDVCSYRHWYNPQEATSPQASPLQNCLLSPVLCRGKELGLLRWCHQTLHNHNSSPLGAKVLFFQPWTPKVKTGCKTKFMASVTTLINVTKATLCGSMCNRGLID